MHFYIHIPSTFNFLYHTEIKFLITTTTTTLAVYADVGGYELPNIKIQNNA